MRQLLLSTLLLLSVAPAFAQRACGTMGHLEHQLATDPEMATRMEAIENHTQHFAQSGGNHERVVITIPVVFHIIHNGDAVGSSENISDTYINAQLSQLNQDYRKLNSDASLIPAAFTGVAADAEINFCLAQRKPDGTATTGINRLNMGQASWTDTQINSNLKPQTIWDRNKYLNIWSVNFGGNSAGLLGYAQFPGGTANTDGVVCVYSSFGSVATPNPAGGVYAKGRTLTHEVGHWLNLRHIWGDANCGSDLVSDTPTQQTSNYGCPSYPHVTCSNGPNGDMFMNYMDYTDDACMYMFSTGQKNRMQALFAAGGARASLATSDGCTAPSGGGTCGTPASLASSSITASGATVSWAAVSGASSYNLQYKTAATSTWTTVSVSGTSSTLSGLSASTTYNYQVAAVCSGTSGSYSAASSFTTLASGGTGTPACTVFESNNTKATAATIPMNATSEAFIGTTTDVDWYRFTTTSSATRVRIQLTSLPADYDVKLYRNSSNTVIGLSENSGTTNEQIIYNSTSSATYYVRVYGYNSANSCSDSYLLNVATSSTNFKTIEGLTLVNDNEISAINLFPNPTADKVNINFISTAEGNVTVRVYDLAGRQVAQQQSSVAEGSNTIGMDTQQLQTGYYFVQVDNGTMRQQSRLMVAH